MYIEQIKEKIREVVGEVVKESQRTQEEIKIKEIKIKTRNRTKEEKDIDSAHLKLRYTYAKRLSSMLKYLQKAREVYLQCKVSTLLKILELFITL